MTVKYEYKSDCCGHNYVEQRAAEEPMFFPTCNVCKIGTYELVNETVIATEVERVEAPIVAAEEAEPKVVK